jgi:hypothetical protein
MIIDYINHHLGEFWIAAGFLLLTAEVLIMGMASGVLLFAGLGALATGMLMLAGVLPETWAAGISSFGISSGVITALLWKPLRRMQGGRALGKNTSSDLIGLEFVAEQDITPLAPGTKRYSGIQWRVEIDKDAGVDAIHAGQRVAVTSVDVGIFRVKAV